MNAGEIVRYQGDVLSRAKAWANLPESDLRRAAMQAASERDPVRLWALTEAYIVLHGRSGARVSPNTLENYERGVRFLLEHWEGESVLRPARDAALAYVRELEDAGQAPGTISVRLAAARMLYKALRWARATQATPFEDVKAPRDPTPAEEKREAYTPEEVSDMLELADPVERALVLLGAHAGLRVSEILALEWPDVSLDAGTLRVRHGKGGKAATVVLSGSLAGVLEDLPGGREGPVMPFRDPNTARYHLRQLCGRCWGFHWTEAVSGNKVRRARNYKGMHALRHYCGTRIYRATGDLRVAAKHLRHANMNTSAVYAKMDRSAVMNEVRQW